MLRIAVCDDAPGDLENLVALVKRYLHGQPKLGGQIAPFSDGEALLAQVAQGERFDIIILDILMPGRDGIDIGHALRESGYSGIILYLTSSTDFAIDSYDVRAFHYLLKPITPEKFFAVLDAAADICTSRQNEYIMIQTANGPRRVLLDEILYIERSGRAMRYVCDHEKIQTRTLRGAFRDAVQALLADPRFVLCGASFLVNLSRIAGIDGQEVLLDTGSVVSMPRTAAPALKRQWGAYWLAQHRNLEGGGGYESAH